MGTPASGRVAGSSLGPLRLPGPQTGRARTRAARGGSPPEPGSPPGARHPRTGGRAGGPPGSLRARLHDLERALLDEALAACRGNVSGAATFLGMDRVVLHGKLAAVGLLGRARELRATLGGGRRVAVPPRAVPFWAELEVLERSLVGAALATHRGNLSRAARALKVDRGSLLRRVRRLGLDALASGRLGRPRRPGVAGRRRRRG